MRVSPLVSHCCVSAKILAVRTSMADSGLDFSVFVPAEVTPQQPRRRETHFSTPDGDANDPDVEEYSGQNGHLLEAEEPGERSSRTVIKLRSSRHSGIARSRSRSRRDLSLVAADEDYRPVSPDSADPDNLANVRFSAHALAKADINQLLPFALIAPEGHRRRQRPVSSDSQLLDTVPSSPVPLQEDELPPQTPASTNSARLPYNPPDDLKGIFTRKFRWGVIDVLDPNHCDFATFRTAILSTHLKVSLSQNVFPELFALHIVKSS